MKKINMLVISWGFFVALCVVVIIDQFENIPYLIEIASILLLGSIATLLIIKNIIQSDSKIRHMAFHDPLTGLANRNQFEQHLNQVLAHSHKHGEMFSLIMLDIDFFKNINDSLGHDAGDCLLQIIGKRLQNTIRSKDMVARLGGDEFIIIISDIKKADVIAQISQKILNSLLETIMLKGHEIYVTASIGISLYPYDGKDIDTLIKNADLALYRAKENGRNNYQFCTSDMTEKAQQKIERQNALNHALVKNEFFLYYQPSIEMSSKRITSIEALLRWQSKEYGFVTPDSIISIAEESGLIISLSEWIIRTACKQVKSWQTNRFLSLKLAVNISVRQFKSVDFVNTLLKILKETEFQPENLVIEVTEGMIIHDPKNTIKTLSKLKKAGICIVVDDFGTGFSSFSYLTSDAVTKIKIDKSFVNRLEKERETVTIVSAMIAMAKKLGIKTVAEGVETQEQYDILQREGCDEAQGYYISKPLPSELIETFLATRSIAVSS